MIALQTAIRALTLLVFALTVYVVIRIVYNLYFHPLREYPGPLAWRATRLTWVLALQRGCLHRDLLALHDKYGPVVRVAPDELSYVDPRAWKDIYIGKLSGSARLGHARAPIERNGIWFRKQRADEPEAIMSSNEEAHARFRRAFTGAFSEKAVRDQAPLIEKYVALMVQKFRAMADDGSRNDGAAVVDIVSWLNFVTFDISADLSFGESFGSTEQARPHPWVEIACRFGKGIALAASLNYFAPLQKVLRYTMPRAVREKMVYHRELSTRKVRQRLQLEGERADFVQAVLNYNTDREKSEGEKVTPQELELNMSVMVFAGSETSSTAMASVLFGLLNSQRAMTRVTAEVRSAFQHEEDIDVASVGGLEYLTAVINEGLRLGPPSAVTVPRIVPASGEEICGRWVPGGTFVTVNQYPAFRSAANFSNPNEYIPERFLPGETPSPSDNLAAFNPFLVGRHMCIGQRFAWAEMRLILARLLYAFDITWDVTPRIKDWGEQQTFIFWQKDPLFIRLKPR
ncbi:Versicolorin B desaturase [Cladophialophora carrionii]|uniref:Versicolorin B desaturase n=1 Tax=Cladophialophora carrionii TaxID=86049 RepID=A0A1C1CVX2_9EURO|nr:Versicolorin B desaturase [Cladophialophora carrionii]